MRFLNSFGCLIIGFKVLLAGTTPGCTASPELERALTTRPSANAFNAAGAYFAQRQQLRCAVNAFESALRLDPDSWEGHYNLGLALLEKAEPARAAKELRLVVRQHPEKL